MRMERPNIPAPPPAPMAVPKVDRSPELLGALKGRVPPIPVPLIYRVGLFFLACAMIVLPIVYLSLIALVGYGTYYHAVNSTGIFTVGSDRGRGVLAAALVYFAPIVAGGLLIVFMIKPLFAGRGKQERPRTLIRAHEPLLFAFVEHLCAAVGAPVPTEIRVDSQVNASASFRRGFLSLFGNDLVLTIGLPMAQGLTLDQLAGVLAHEFGHFAQSTGMRLTYVIRSVNIWFARVVYERDAWDEALKHYASETDIRLGIVLHFVRLCVWLTRQILWVLMMIGHGLSCFMLRQMEYDADAYECHLSGSACFAATTGRMTQLSAGHQWAIANLQDSWNEQRLVDDLPAYVAGLADRIPPEIRAKIDKSLAETRTGFFDTHPSGTDRLKAARAMNQRGLFHLNRPASELFGNFATLCRVVTFDFYKEVLGQQVKREHLRPVSEFLDRQKEEEREAKAVARYFQRQVSPLRPLAIAAPRAAPDPQSLIQEVRKAREHIVKLAPGYAEDLRVFARARSQEKRALLAERMAPLEVAARNRLAGSLELLGHDDVAARVEGAAEVRQEAARLLPVLRRLNEFWPEVLDLRIHHNALMEMLEHIEQKKEDPAYVQEVLDRTDTLRDAWGRVKNGVPDIGYPFEHSAGNIALGQYLGAAEPGPQDLGATVEASTELLTKLFTLYNRVLGRLVLAAEAVENALGLPPLPEPPPEKDAP